MGSKPKDFSNVLAHIRHIGDLVTTEYYEVVYFCDNEWKSYAGSNTFEDGEIVIRWIYIDDIKYNWVNII